ncbi:unnamed protein product [marine sediment metagenome]|uniref:Uncharacterized protein n=1 Tax=marine sediment metagenome TaxID=412755 RepID=X1UK46_9ZZZZ
MNKYLVKKIEARSQNSGDRILNSVQHRVSKEEKKEIDKI